MLCWRIDPLPDFLVDHTLPSQNDAERMREVVSRWVQWISNLWGWHDRATFAIRYVASNGKIGAYLLAVAHSAAEEELLAGEIGVLLRAHRLSSGIVLDAGELAAAVATWEFSSPVIVEVRQHTTRALWQLRANAAASPSFKQQFGWLAEQDVREPRVVFPWWAPGGPYLVPMESLISQPIAVSLTAYIQPTQLSANEWTWLAAMASEAQSKGEQSLQQLGAPGAMRVVDPSAALAGRLYIANLRRLSTNPFLVCVHCVAAEGRADVARSLAGAMQSLVQEPPFDRPQQEDDRLPSAADVTSHGDASPSAGSEAVFRQYRQLRFTECRADDSLSRLPYLVDARGAATVFRLPLSVRGGVPGLRVRQLPPDFHPGPRQQDALPGHLILGTYEAGGLAQVPVNDLCKHVLVTGFTGSGKTVTALQLLHQLWVDHNVPFLVLESAKQEYRGLLGVQGLGADVRVYTLGNELCVPLRLNPFELLRGVRVEAHISKLQACIEGAIPPVGPSSSVIAVALLRVYESKGWCLTDVYPLEGASSREFPTLSDFVSEVTRVLEERGYEGDLASNLKAAIVGRFQPLLLGGKGRMFDTQRSCPAPDELFGMPTVLEMNDLNTDDKALVVMFLLTFLREHRERNRSRGGELLHVTMVEEAHNVLENVSSKGSGEGATSADTRYKAVEAFCQLLTEIRALGEGLIIADQSPEKLARDALRNTNLQIAHQLRDGHDREAIANAMIMEKEQRDFLGKLAPGCAALFRTGLEKATFIRVSRYYPDASHDAAAGGSSEAQRSGACRGEGFNSNLSDDDVRATMDQRVPVTASLRTLSVPFDTCRLCREQCLHRDRAFTVMRSEWGQETSREWLQRFYEDEHVTGRELWDDLVGRLRRVASRAGLAEGRADELWCLFAHLWATKHGAHAQPGSQVTSEERGNFNASLMRS